jgi:predicted alpha/beta superfamily hydrolase
MVVLCNHQIANNSHNPQENLMKYKPFTKTMLIFIMATYLCTGCGPSPEQQELIFLGMTAEAATPCPECPEPKPTSPCPEPESTECNCQANMPFNMGTMQFDSELAGRSYNIYISLPVMYNVTPYDYRTVYVLDGDILFGTTADILHTQAFAGTIDDAIIVGIGYVTDSIDDLFTYRWHDTDTQGPNYAGFTSFLLEELIPYIEDNYRTDPSDRTILGHSLTGLYPLTIMFEHPDTFTKIISMSPSLFANDREIFSLEEAYWQDHNELPVTIFFSVGENEDTMVTDLEEFISIIESREYESFTQQYELIPEEDHMSVAPFSISKGVRATGK